MRCLSPTELEQEFGGGGFSVSLQHEWYRSALVLDEGHSLPQQRIAAEQPNDFAVISLFVRDVIRWLPTNRGRLLWVDHWETGVYGGHENALAVWAWRGFGEHRAIETTPGLLFEAQDWTEVDQTEMKPANAEAMGVLTGLIVLLMMTQSDGWLIADDCADRVEFWEGNFFFHSADPLRLKSGNALVDRYGCSRWKTSA